MLLIKHSYKDSLTDFYETADLESSLDSETSICKGKKYKIKTSLQIWKIHVGNIVIRRYTDIRSWATAKGN